jgi:hypothetical protein
VRVNHPPRLPDEIIPPHIFGNCLVAVPLPSFFLKSNRHMAVTAVATWTAVPACRATTRVQIDPEPQNVLSLVPHSVLGDVNKGGALRRGAERRSR